MRLIVDGRFSETVRYYQTFPSEPTLPDPQSFAIDLPLAREDHLQPISLDTILTRMVAVRETRVLIYCHGNPEGLAVALVANSSDTADRTVLHLITVFSDARTRAQAIAQLPADQQSRAWHTLLRGLRGFGREQIFPDLAADQEPSVYAGLLRQAEVAARQTWDRVGQAEFDRLLTNRLQIKQRAMERIEIRGCNIGRDAATMRVIREFFRAREVVAPNTVIFDGSMTVIQDAAFERDLTRNVATRTTRASSVAGNAPVDMYRRLSRELPPVRLYEVDAGHAGNDVFIRLWATSLRPHLFAGWMVASSTAAARAWVEQNLSPDSSRYRNGTAIPLHALWLRDDEDVPLDRQPLDLSGDPLATPVIPPPFAMPLDPQFRQHLVLSSAPTPATP